MSDMTNVTTGEVRLSFVHLFKPYAFKGEKEAKYSCTVLVPKTDASTMMRIQGAIEAATQKGVNNKWNGNRPTVVPTPVHDGDGVRPSDMSEFGPECKGCWVFRAKSDYPPEVVDQNLNPIINQSEVYSGMYARVNVSFFPYDFGGKKGVGCSLGAVQKLRDGEALGGSMPSAAKAFGSAAPQPAGAPAAYQSQPSYNQYGYGQPPQPGYIQPPLPAAGYGQYPQMPHGQTPHGQAPGQGPMTGGINPITGLPY